VAKTFASATPSTDPASVDGRTDLGTV